MGQGGDGMPPGSKAFAGLEVKPKFQNVLKRFAENRTPISRATQVLTLPESNFVAKDIDYDSYSKSFLITGVLAKKIQPLLATKVRDLSFTIN